MFIKFDELGKNSEEKAKGENNKNIMEKLIK